MQVYAKASAWVYYCLAHIFNIHNLLISGNTDGNAISWGRGGDLLGYCKTSGARRFYPRGAISWRMRFTVVIIPIANATQSKRTEDAWSFSEHIVVMFIAMYGELWLAWLLRVCNYKLPEFLPCLREQLILQIWWWWHMQLMTYKCVLSAQLNANVVQTINSLLTFPSCSILVTACISEAMYRSLSKNLYVVTHISCLQCLHHMQAITTTMVVPHT